MTVTEGTLGTQRSSETEWTTEAEYTYCSNSRGEEAMKAANTKKRSTEAARMQTAFRTPTAEIRPTHDYEKLFAKISRGKGQQYE